jgi:hypothetical protein
MERINSTKSTEYITLNRTFNKEIQLNAYDNQTFEGACIFLTKDQAKDLVNKLQTLIYKE